MPRRNIIYQQGSYYHIYNRGAARQPLFREPANMAYAVMLLDRYAARYQIAVIAYCLMENHYHLLVRQDGAFSASCLVQYTFNAYAKAYNLRYGLTGTLFEGTYKVKPIAQDEYLYHLCRYIHANPVQAGLVTRPEDWCYSNYREWVGLRNSRLVDAATVAECTACVGDYATFVAEQEEADGEGRW